MPIVNIHTIGAGGGSIGLRGGRRPARRPAERRRRAGPSLLRRAAATRPTVTDANLVLGRIAPEHFAGGRMTLDAERPAPPSPTSPPSSASASPSSPRGSSTSSTRRWRRRSGRSPWSRGSSRATSRSSRSAAPARCTPPSSPQELEIARGHRAAAPGRVLGLGDARDGAAPRLQPPVLRRAADADLADLAAICRTLEAEGARRSRPRASPPTRGASSTRSTCATRRRSTR